MVLVIDDNDDGYTFLVFEFLGGIYDSVRALVALISLGGIH